MALDGWDKDISPYHEGERALHDRLGRKERQDQMGRRIHRPFMPQQHRDFFEQLPFFIAGSLDQQGRPWASILFGKPGFLQTPNDRRLTIDAGRIEHDPFFENARPGAPLGFVGIELPTRRRNRMNGTVGVADGPLSVDVVQSYGNCPQYIHTRAFTQQRDPQADFSPKIERFDSLPQDIAALIARSDAFYVASANPEADQDVNGGVDVNHRGGRPGFVKIDGNTLTVPDFIGNFAFNTLGNFLVYPKAGLLFIDSETGDLVQLTGNVDILWDVDAEIEAFRGAERAWRFHLDHGHVLREAAPYRWAGGELSPNSQLTGDWNEAAQTFDAKQNEQAWRDFRVEKVVQEASIITSFHLVPADGSALVPFKPGQFLTLQVQPEDEVLTRTYTLSSAPSDPFYRISVKREGAVSSYLHDHVAEGAVLKVRAPKGAFWLDTDERRPAVLLAAGVGITPMISMARQALTDAFARRHMRPLTVVHAAQTVDQRAFAAEFSEIQTASQSGLRYVSVIERPEPDEAAGQHYHVEGRISPELLKSLLPLDDYDFYLCGPPPFMQGVYDTLISLGVSDARIQAEAFGPASLIRKVSESFVEAPKEAERATVEFATSGTQAEWSPEKGTLLEFAEAEGLTPAFGCRGGSCGTCAVRLKSGAVTYRTTPTADVEDGEVLICCAVPARSDETLSVDL